MSDDRQLERTMATRPGSEQGNGAGSVRRGAVFGAASHAGAAAGSWFTGIVVARLLGADGAGEYTVALTFVLTLTAFSGSGVATGIAYYASRREWAPGDALRQILLASGLFGLVGITVGALAMLALRDTALAGLSTGALLLCLAAVPFALTWIYVTHLALGLHRYALYAAGAPLHTVSALLLALLLTPILGVEGAVLALASSHALSAISTVLWLRRVLGRALPGWLSRASRDLARAIRFGLKSYAYIALNFLNLRLDLIVLAASASSATVGHYGVAVSVTTLGPLLPRGLAPVVLARVAKLDSMERDSERDEVAIRSIRHAVLLVLAVALVLAILLAAIPVIYGSEFADSTGLGFLLLPGVCALGVSGVMTANVIGRGRPEYELYTALVCTPLTVLAYVLLIPSTGAVGAATASTACYVLTLAVTYLFFRRTTGISGLSPFVPTRQELRDYALMVTNLKHRLATNE